MIELRELVELSQEAFRTSVVLRFEFASLIAELKKTREEMARRTVDLREARS